MTARSGTTAKLVKAGMIGTNLPVSADLSSLLTLNNRLAKSLPELTLCRLQANCGHVRQGAGAGWGQIRHDQFDRQNRRNRPLLRLWSLSTGRGPTRRDSCRPEEEGEEGGSNGQSADCCSEHATADCPPPVSRKRAVPSPGYSVLSVLSAKSCNAKKGKDLHAKEGPKGLKGLFFTSVL